MEGIFNIDANDTICAVSTPPGRGGVAMIRVSGPEALNVCQRLWQGHSLTGAQSHTVHYGRIMDGTEVLDEAVASIFRAPRSYTGDDVVELSVHGSPYIQNRLLQLLTADATLCRIALPGEFTRRAYLAGKLDLAQAEAVADVIASASRGALRLSMQQLGGAMSRHIDTLRESLVEFASLLELELDFSEEDVEFASRPDLIAKCTEIEETLQRLASSYSSGRAITQGLPVVIAGIPNAGKSTLLNRLLDDDKAIVSDIPGTTRDIIEDSIEIDGILFKFTDTAGLHSQAADAVEEIGIERAYDRIGRGSILLYLFDATTNSDWDCQLATFNDTLHRFVTDGTIVIPVLNKTDVVEESRLDYLYKQLDNSISENKTGKKITIHDPLRHSSESTSSLTVLQKALVSVAKKLLETTGSEPILTNARHYEAIRQALTNLSQVRGGLEDGQSIDLVAQHLRQAIASLAEITGSITTPDLLTTIFSRFCIGK